MNKLLGARETKARFLSKPRQKDPAEFASSSISRSLGPVLPRSHTTSDVSPGTTSTSLRQRSGPQPLSETEQYWAARALAAETLLAARTTHHDEIRGILAYAENNRTRDLSKLTREHNARHAQLEKIIIGLVLFLLAFACFLAYLFTHSIMYPRREASRWSAVSLPNHLTIPVLSAFTSVTETETAVIGARSITLFILVMGVLIYGLARHWMQVKSRPNS